MSVEKILGRHSLGTMQASGNNVGSVLRGCRRKAGFTCDSHVIEKKTNKQTNKPPPQKEEEEEDEENVFRLVCRYCDILLFNEHYCKCQLRKKKKIKERTEENLI